MARVLIILALLLASYPARAMYLSGADLARKCLSDVAEDIHACTNYVAGVVDYHVLLQSLGTQPTIDFCLPPSVNMQQAAVLVMAYMRTAPQNDAFIAASTVPLALNKVFPCKAQKKKK